jgi:amidase
MCGEEKTMRKVLFLVLFVPGVLLAQSAQEAAHPVNPGVTGRWVVNADFFGSTVYFRLELKQDGEKLSGNFDGDKLEGTLKRNTIYFLAKDEEGGTEEGKGTVEGGSMSGTVVFTNSDNAAHPETYKFTADLVPTRRAGAAQRHEFVPTTFYRQFSAANKAVLKIWPGDSGTRQRWMRAGRMKRAYRGC